MTPEMTPMEFRKLRDKLRVTQVELGEMLGTTSISVSRYETGLRAISDTVAILLRLLVKQRRQGRKTTARAIERRTGT
jgi:DNA-binding transcriptional regulator YiaG